MKLTLASRTNPEYGTLSRLLDASILDQGPGTPGYGKVLNELGLNAWRHIHYGFYFEDIPSVDLNFILMESSLKCSFHSGAGILSGSVEDWHRAFKVFCQSSRTFELRGLFNAIMMLLEHDGIRFDFTKKLELADRTFEVR